MSVSGTVDDPRARYQSYGGLLLILLGLVTFLVGSKESRYESVGTKARARVIAKEIRSYSWRGTFHGVTYRFTAAGQTLQREGDAGDRKAWDAIRIGDDVDVEWVDATPEETRLAVERLTGSRVYYGIAAGLALGGLVLLCLRLRSGLRPSAGL